MKNVHIYSAEQNGFAAFYLEARGGLYHAGLIKGNADEALITGLISFFASRGPENSLVYLHTDQRILCEDLMKFKELTAGAVDQISHTVKPPMWRKLREATHSFQMLITYHTETKEDAETERLKFYVKRMLEKQDSR